MEIISITPSSPLCRAFEDDELLNYAWICDLTGCNFNGIMGNGELAARVAWQLDPPWYSEKGVVGIVTLETLYRYRRRGYAQELVNYVRGRFPDRPVVLEINTPWAYHFWQRYKPDTMGRGRGHSTLLRLVPLTKNREAI
ncbi:MAG: GNAT family N-acetyltransferase [Firmicutes bacterium]|nr:GNAT family N-acetyltransferase [Bacillota bacterium]